MKKIFLFSFFMLSSIAMTSCTTDPVEDNTVQANTVDTGGQTGGLTPPPPPKP
jgi:hypothetical protein